MGGRAPVPVADRADLGCPGLHTNVLMYNSLAFASPHTPTKTPVMVPKTLSAFGGESPRGARPLSEHQAEGRRGTIVRAVKTCTSSPCWFSVR